MLPSCTSRPTPAKQKLDDDSRCLWHYQHPDTSLMAQRASAVRLEAKRGTHAREGTRRLASHEQSMTGDEPKPKRRRICSQTEAHIPLEDLELSLPADITDYIRLNAALLKALSIHFIHGGQATTVDLRTLVSSVTKIWGKALVTQNELRRCLATVSRATDTPVFTLFDYGHGKICVEKALKSIDSPTPASHLDLQDLGRRFERCIRTEWTAHIQATAFESTEAATASFISNQPQEDVVLAPSLENLQPQLLRNRQRLDKLKLESRHTCGQSGPSTSEATAQPRPALKSRNATLLARIQAKQARDCKAEDLYTAEQVAKRAALMRLEEIVPILSGATGKAARKSFPLTLLIQVIKESTQKAWSNEEIKLSIEVLCDVECQGFVNLVRDGRMVAAVIDARHRPTNLAGLLRSALTTL